MSLVSKWISVYHISTKYYSQIQILDYQICCSLLVCVALWVMYVFYEALYIHSGKTKVLRKKTQQNKTIFSAVCDIFLFTLLWYFDWRKQIFSMNLVTTKHSQVLDASTKSMRSLNDSQLFCLMLDMDHKVLFRVLSLPVQWLKS